MSPSTIIPFGVTRPNYLVEPARDGLWHIVRKGTGIIVGRGYGSAAAACHDATAMENGRADDCPAHGSSCPKGCAI